MTANAYIILGFIAIFIIGLGRIVVSFRTLNKRLYFLQEYRNRFIELANGYFGSSYNAARSFDQQAYQWLTLNSAKAQRQIGSFGVGEFLAPFQRYKISNYQFIVNTLPKFQDGHIHQNEVNTVENALLRCIGDYSNQKEDLLSELKNPVKWFQYGVRFLVSFPAQLLNWFGIINNNTLNNITANGFFTVFSGMVGLVAFLSSVVTIFTGWEVFTKMVLEMFKNIKR